MAHELIDTVTATPTGPLTIPVGQTVAVTMRYTLNGPPSGSPSASTYSLTLQKVSPGLPFSIAPSHSPAAANTDYETTANIFSSGGTYVLRARGHVQYTPFADQEVFSEDITVFVTDIAELQATPGTIDEGQGVTTTVTEGQPTATTVTEGQAVTTTVTEGQATGTTVTEGT